MNMPSKEMGPVPWGRTKAWIGYQPEQKVKTFLTFLLMTVVGISTVGPFIIMLSVSLTQDINFRSFPLTLGNFVLLFSRTLATRWLYNSFIVALISTLGGVITPAMAGYAFARGNFIGKEFLFYIFIGILIMPDMALIIPQYILLSDLGLVNSYTALIGPWFASIFGTFLMRQQFLTIPRDYDDAAHIDGANLFQIF